MKRPCSSRLRARGSSHGCARPPRRPSAERRHPVRGADRHVHRARPVRPDLDRVGGDPVLELGPDLVQVALLAGHPVGGREQREVLEAGQLPGTLMSDPSGWMPGAGAMWRERPPAAGLEVGRQSIRWPSSTGPEPSRSNRCAAHRVRALDQGGAVDRAEPPLQIGDRPGSASSAGPRSADAASPPSARRTSPGRACSGASPGVPAASGARAIWNATLAAVRVPVMGPSRPRPRPRGGATRSRAHAIATASATIGRRDDGGPAFDMTSALRSPSRGACGPTCC